MKVRLTNSKLTEIPIEQAVEVIVVPLPNHRDWNRPIDIALQRVTGDQFHRIALEKLSCYPLCDQQVVIVGTSRPHLGNFRDVLFIVDAGEKPVSFTLNAVLETLMRKNYIKARIPVMRTGVTLGKFESHSGMVAANMHMVMQKFAERYPSCGLELTISDQDRRAMTYLANHYPMW